MLDGIYAVEPFMIVLDGLQVASDVDALSECVLGGLKNLATDAVLQAGLKELMLDKFEGVGDAFGLDFGLGSTGSNGATNSSDGIIFSQNIKQFASKNICKNWQ